MATASSAADQALERALDSLSSEKAPPSNERMQSLKGLLQCGLSDPEGSLSRCGHLLYCLKGGGPPGLSDTMTIYDMNRLQCLRDIATELGINVFVAQLEKVVEGTHYGHPDHEFDCEERPSSDSESESEESELDYQPGDLHDEDVRWAVHIFSEEMPAREIALPFPNPGDSPHADLFDGSPPDEEDEEPGVEGRIGYAPV
ncbi:hypothetical protein GGR56DRAFT_387343 [Xylariaceae sp. FL0804]|nr:hypothetical protein GGR56DRAFT_387343 [Xylariaceae sp. FL0804]